MRTATITRTTKETDIALQLNLDGSGKTSLNTGVGFFDHMLDALSRFALLDLTLTCQGDIQVDAHHTVEDVGICLGRAIREALGDRAGIRRAMYLGLAVVAASFSMLLLRSPWWFCLGSLGAGFAMGMSCVMTPILVREVFGSLDYGRISAIVTIFTTVGVPIATVSLGFLYDAVGSYRPGMVMGVAVTIAAMALVEAVLRLGRRLPVEEAA